MRHTEKKYIILSVQSDEMKKKWKTDWNATYKIDQYKLTWSAKLDRKMVNVNDFCNNLFIIELANGTKYVRSLGDLVFFIDLLGT